MNDNIEAKLLNINNRVDKVSLDIEIIKSNHLAHIESDINSLNFKTDRIEDKVDNLLDITYCSWCIYRNFIS